MRCGDATAQNRACGASECWQPSTKGVKGAERSETDSRRRRLPRRGGAAATSNKWFSLIDKVYADRTIGLAWAKVSFNAGACGVDGITVERFGKDSQKRLLAVKEHLKGGSYQPKSVKRVMVPKPGSAQKRPLGIPTVRDRVVQTALRAERSETDSRQAARRVSEANQWS
jgi:hypothetical protein